MLVVNLCPSCAGFEDQLERLHQVFDGQVLVVTEADRSNAVAFATVQPLTAQYARHGWRGRDRLGDGARRQLMPALLSVARAVQGHRSRDLPRRRPQRSSST